MLAQGALQGFTGFDVYAGADPVEKLDHCYLRPKASPDRAQLQADHAGADHHQMLGHLGQCQGAGGIEDAFVIDVYAGQGRGLGTGGDDDVLGTQFGLATGAIGHRDFTRSVDVAPASDPVDLVLAEKKFDALGQPGNAFILLFHHLGEVEAGFDVDPQVGEFRTHGCIVQFGGMQQRLGGHAADIQASAAECGTSFDAGGLQTQLSGADRRVVTTGATAEYHDVISAHGCTPGSKGEGMGKSSSWIKLRS
ncbi:hypothetical protein D3C84_581380 [compost metagenome]